MAQQVKLFVYDLSQGMARQLSPTFLGKQIDGIWHSGVCAFGHEYYFGGGICTDAPGNTPYGNPIHTHELGPTAKTLAQFLSFLSSIASRFTPAAYHLLDNNCNHFSDACTMFLVGQHIPDYVRDLPAQAMDSPLGPMLRPMVESMQSSIVQQSHGHELSFPESPHSSQSDSTPSAHQTTKLASTPILLTNGNISAIAAKLAQFDPTLTPDISTALHDLDTVSRLIEHGSNAPLSQSFPSLDLLRLAVAAHPSAASAVLPKLPKLLERHVTDADSLHPPSATMALRLALNLHAHAAPPVDILHDALNIALSAAASPPMAKTAALLAQNAAAVPRRADTARSLEEGDITRLLFIIYDVLSSDPPPVPLVAAPLLNAAALLIDGNKDAATILDAYGLDHAICVDDNDEAVRQAARLLQRVRSTQEA